MMKVGFTMYKADDIKGLNYLKATGIKIDSFSEQELLDYCMELNRVRDSIIDDLLTRLTSNFYSKNTYATEINNPQSYENVLKDLRYVADYYEESLQAHILMIPSTTISDLSMDDDTYNFEQAKLTLLHTKKRIEILKLLFDRYCETDWSRVI